jgi:DNA-binding MarR family transcriptional regulator
MSTPTDAGTAALASQMRISIGRLRRRLAAERDRTSVPIAAMAVLGDLERHGAMSIGELADSEQVRPPSMTRIVHGLEDAGCVRRTAHPGDGRITLIELTERGRAMVLADREARDAWLACKLEALPPHERAVLAQAVPLLESLSRCR